jgi:hypothetical protein
LAHRARQALKVVAASPHRIARLPMPALDDGGMNANAFNSSSCATTLSPWRQQIIGRPLTGKDPFDSANERTKIQMRSE